MKATLGRHKAQNTSYCTWQAHLSATCAIDTPLLRNATSFISLQLFLYVHSKQ